MLKIEERIINQLPEDKIDEFYDKHGLNEKLPYAEECGIDVLEVFYLLQPLYNPPLHLHGKPEDMNKVEGACLKLSSRAIRMMVKEVFDDGTNVPF